MMLGEQIVLRRPASADQARHAARWRLWARPDPDWHDEQAGRAEQALDWFAAAFHLRRLVALRPNDPEALRRLTAAVKHLR
jgi:hypothetical protein